MKSDLLGKYIFNEATERERQLVEGWLQEDEHNRIELEQLKKRSTLATRNYRYGAFDPRKASEKVFNRKLQNPVFSGTRFLRSYPFHIAACIAAIWLIGIWFDRFYYASVSYVAPGDVVCELTLPDQSKVILAPGTKITYPKHFSAGDRSIYLEGKGYFEVKPDPEAPFRVKSTQSALEVLGTVFEMQTQEKEHKVFVRSGKVRYESLRTGEHIILTANHGAGIDSSDGNLSKEQLSVNQFSWATKELIFENTPLPEVIESINNAYYSDLKKEEAFNSLRLTGTFRDLDLEHLINLIETTLGIEIARESSL